MESPLDSSGEGSRCFTPPFWVAIARLFLGVNRVVLLRYLHQPGDVFAVSPIMCSMAILLVSPFFFSPFFHPSGGGNVLQPIRPLQFLFP